MKITPDVPVTRELHAIPAGSYCLINGQLRAVIDQDHSSFGGPNLLNDMDSDLIMTFSVESGNLIAENQYTDVLAVEVKEVKYSLQPK